MPTLKPWGYDEEYRYWYMPAPANLHVHFRFDDETMNIVVPETAKIYDYATAMPNFGKKDLIRTPQQALAYRERVLTVARSVNPHFDLNVPFYIEPDTDPDTVIRGRREGAWIAGKLYPQSGTTGSDEGVDFRNLRDLSDVFAAMAESDTKLLGHFEKIVGHGGKKIDPWYREQYAIEHVVGDILIPNPKLKLVWEHVASRAVATAIKRLREQGYRIEATVAPQYLLWYRLQLLDGGMNPLYYSIPVLKEEDDMLAVRELLLDSYGFAGDDSAPHPVANKSKPCGCSGGVFNAPTSFYTYFQFFKNSGRDNWFDRFVEFVSLRGREFYGLPAATRRIAIVEESWNVPMTYGGGDRLFMRMHRGETIPFCVMSVEEAQKRILKAA